MSAGLVAYDASKSLIEDGWIEEVLFPVKSGKEANVYCCRACPGRGYAFFALKVYKAPKHRSFRDAAVYQEGRVIANARTARAVRNKSRFGRAAECLIPAFDGAIFSVEWKDALWARFLMEAPRRRRRSVERYSIVKRA